MGSVLALWSKGIFDLGFSGRGPGDTLPIDRHASKHKALEPLQEGGDLYLTTVRPGDELWLIGVLRQPHFDGEGFVSSPNTVPVRAANALKQTLVFSTGKGMSIEPGKLGMSLQTPRTLTPEDVQHLEALLGGQPTPLQVPPPPPMAARPAKPSRSAKATEPAMRVRVPDQPSLALETVLEALERGDPVGALDRLLEVWNKSPSPSLGDRVVRLSRLLDRSLPPLTSIEQHTDVLGARRPMDMVRLTAGIETARVPEMVARMRNLALCDRNPVLQRAVLGLLELHTSTERQPGITRALKIVEGSDLRPALEALLPRVPQDWTRPRLEKVLAKTPAVPDIDSTSLSGLDSALDALEVGPIPTEAALLTSVRADPAEIERQALIDGYLADPSPGSLAVLADALTERGDPRGELILLQQLERPSGMQRARIAALLKEHQLEWCRPLDGVLAPTSIRFENGFLSAGVARFETDAQRQALIGHPLWSTVVELECNESAVLTHPVMRSLRRADLGPAALSELATADREIPLEAVIGTTYNDYGLWLRSGLDGNDPAALAPALEVGSLRNLRRMSLQLRSRSAAELRWLWSSPLGQQLELLDLYIHRHRIGTWVPVLKDLPRLKYVMHRFTNGNTASGTGQVLAILALSHTGITLQINRGDLTYLTMPEQLAENLTGFPFEVHPRIEVQYIGSKKLDPQSFAGLGAVLRRIGFSEVALPTTSSVRLEV